MQISQNDLTLVKREEMSFDVQFKDYKNLQNLYRSILDAGIELQEIRSRKTSLQEIFIKELADNE